MSGSGKWFAVLVIVLFLASMFSVVLWKISDNSSTETKVVDDPLNSISIVYSATAKGKVIQMPANNTYLLYAQTNNPDVSALDSSLKSIPKILNVFSQFQILDENSEYDYMYLAQIIVEENLDYFSINGFISDLNSFGTFEVYPYLLVEYDSFLKFENKDLNLIKELSLGGSNIIVLADGYTLLNDEIEFIVTANFIGNKLSNYNAIISNNLTAYPKVVQSIYSSDYLVAEDANYSEDYLFGYIYVDEINYLGENILIDKNLPVISYDVNNAVHYGIVKSEINKKNQYRLELTFVRDILSEGYAVYLGDMNV